MMGNLPFSLHQNSVWEIKLFSFPPPTQQKKKSENVLVNLSSIPNPVQTLLYSHWYHLCLSRTDQLHPWPPSCPEARSAGCHPPDCCPATHSAPMQGYHSVPMWGCHSALARECYVQGRMCCSSYTCLLRCSTHSVSHYSQENMYRNAAKQSH